MVEDSIIVPKSIMDIEFKVFWTNIKNQLLFWITLFGGAMF